MYPAFGSSQGPERFSRRFRPLSFRNPITYMSADMLGRRLTRGEVTEAWSLAYRARFWDRDNWEGLEDRPWFKDECETVWEVVRGRRSLEDVCEDLIQNECQFWAMARETLPGVLGEEVVDIVFSVSTSRISVIEVASEGEFVLSS